MRGAAGPHGFQPAPPARAETQLHLLAVIPRHISTRSAREGGDATEYYQDIDPALFQPAPPARSETSPSWSRPWVSPDFNPLRPRGRRHTVGGTYVAGVEFQPAPPARAETQEDADYAYIMAISTRSAREGGDLTRRTVSVPLAKISTRSAREGGDAPPPGTPRHPMNFNPLHPRGRRRSAHRRFPPPSQFQPAPPARAETRAGSMSRSLHNFNPLRPRGRRPMPWGALTTTVYFNPLRPRGRRRLIQYRLEQLEKISTRSAREGGDVSAYPAQRRTADFNPLRPRGRRRRGYAGE